jgi:hypothetical protein
VYLAPTMIPSLERLACSLGGVARRSRGLLSGCHLEPLSIGTSLMCSCRSLKTACDVASAHPPCLLTPTRLPFSLTQSSHQLSLTIIAASYAFAGRSAPRGALGDILCPTPVRIPLPCRHATCRRPPRAMTAYRDSTRGGGVFAYCPSVEGEWPRRRWRERPSDVYSYPHSE